MDKKMDTNVGNFRFGILKGNRNKLLFDAWKLEYKNYMYWNHSLVTAAQYYDSHSYWTQYRQQVTIMNYLMANSKSVIVIFFSFGYLLDGITDIYSV